MSPENFVQAIKNLNPVYHATLAEIQKVEGDDEKSTLEVKLSNGEILEKVTHNYNGKPKVKATCILIFRDNKNSRPHAVDISEYESLKIEIGKSKVLIKGKKIELEHDDISIKLEKNKTKIKAQTLEVEGDIITKGKIKAGSEIVAQTKTLPVYLSTHQHPSAPPGPPSPPKSG